VYTEFGGIIPSLDPDYAEGSIDVTQSGSFDLVTAGLMLHPMTGSYVSYTGTTWPNLQKGSMEFIVQGADLKANQGTDIYLFDMQENSDPSSDEKRVEVYRKSTDSLEFRLRSIVGDEVIARINKADLLSPSMPDGEVKVHVIWDVNAVDYQDRAIIKIWNGAQEVFTGYNLVPGTNPNLGTNTASTYNFFIGAESTGVGGTQFPGFIQSFMIKSE